MAASNTCTRLLPVSDTAIRVPSGEYATERGLSSCPVPLPCVPNSKSSVPFAAWYTWMLPPVTLGRAIRSPSGREYAMLPRTPASTLSSVPFAAWNICVRLLLPSATAIRVPSGDQSTGPGCRNWPGAVPFDPNAKSMVPSTALNTWTLVVSGLAVTILAPSGEYATSCGRLRCPSPDSTLRPKSKANVPSG